MAPTPHEWFAAIGMAKSAATGVIAMATEDHRGRAIRVIAMPCKQQSGPSPIGGRGTTGIGHRQSRLVIREPAQTRCRPPTRSEELLATTTIDGGYGVAL